MPDQQHDTPQNPATERGSSFLDPQVHGGPMRLADLVGGYWAITPDMHDEIRSIYAAHMRGEKIDISGVEARLGRALANERQNYQVMDGGVAVIQMQGVISPKANLFTSISGGTSAQQLRADILAAAADPKVKSGILYGDTPGGNVLGVAEAAAAWRDFAQAKPAVTLSDGVLASGGIWVGAGAPKIMITGPMVHVGSIGVRTEHLDTSTADAARGVKRTIIAAGKYKAAGDGPLTPESFAYKQAQVDYLYTVFVDWIAAMRGVSAEQVLADMADGRVFMGQQAIDAGLVDGYASLEGLITQMASDPLSVTALRAAPGGGRRTVRQSPARAAAAPAAGAAAEAGQGAANPQDVPVPPVETSSSTTQGNTMSDITRESLERDHSALFAALRSEFMAAGAAAEIARIQAVRAQSLPGCEALIEKLAFDGRTTGPEASMAIVVAQREALASAGRAHHADAPAAVPNASQSAAEAEKDKPAKRQPNYQAAYAGLNKRAA